MLGHALEAELGEITLAVAILVAFTQVLPGAVVGALVGLGISLLRASSKSERSDAGTTVLWMVGCGVLGAIVTPTVVAAFSS